MVKCALQNRYRMTTQAVDLSVNRRDIDPFLTAPIPIPIVRGSVGR